MTHQRIAMRASVFVVIVAAWGCSGTAAQPSAGAEGGAPDAAVEDAAASPSVDASPAAVMVDWVIAVDPTVPAQRLNPALLGHYDLSGALFAYDKVPGLVPAMKSIGFSDWRVGLGRWEAATELFPTLTDASKSCAALVSALPQEATSSYASDLDLIAARDWFTDDGSAVTAAMTADESRYALGYVRSVLDVAASFGATPFVDVDLMPRALSANRTPLRGSDLQGVDPCSLTWSNKVSNVAPADPNVYAAAVVGAVKRVVEGSAGQAPRVAPYWEIWNEPELAYAWDPSFEAAPGKLDRFFAMALTTLVALDAYRTANPSSAPVKGLHFGLGSFARAATAAATLAALDATALPGGAFTPLDFVSFHSYWDDPTKVVADIQTVVNARKATTHYAGAELVLAEWGASLSTMPPLPDTTIDRALHHAFVLAVGANLGLSRAHQSIFYDFYAGLGLGILDHDAKPKPAYYAYELLARVIAGGADRLAVAGHDDGQFDAGKGAVLASRDSSGKVRALVVNLGTAQQTARIDVAGKAGPPSRITMLDDPTRPPHDVPVGSGSGASVIVVPPRAMALIEL